MKIGEYFFKTPFSFLGIYSENLQDCKQFNFKFFGGSHQIFFICTVSLCWNGPYGSAHHSCFIMLLCFLIPYSLVKRNAEFILLPIAPLIPLIPSDSGTMFFSVSYSRFL